MARFIDVQRIVSGRWLTIAVDHITSIEPMFKADGTWTYTTIRVRGDQPAEVNHSVEQIMEAIVKPDHRIGASLE